VIGGLISGSLSDKLNNKALLLVILSFPFVALLINAQISYDISFKSIALIAVLFGVGSSVPILLKLGVNAIPPEKYGAGSGLLSFIRDFGVPFGSVTGIVTFSSISAAATQTSLVDRAKNIGVDASLMNDVEQAGLSGGESISEALTDQLQSLGYTFDQIMLQASGEGVSVAVQNLSYIAAGLFLVLIILTLFIPSQKKEASIVEKTIKQDSKQEKLAAE